MMFREIRCLLYHEFLLEWRNPYAAMGVLIFLTSVIFICYLLPGAAGNTALFWIIAMFIAPQAVARCFIQQAPGLRLYYYTLSSSFSAIAAKLIYNTLQMFFYLWLAWGIFVLLLDNPAEDLCIFAFAIFLGSAGLSGIYTLISALSAGARHPSLLVAILGFPLLLPLLTLTLRLSEIALSGAAAELPWRDITLLFLLDVIIMTLALLLFPYLWRD